jgi:hypothetical protein
MEHPLYSPDWALNDFWLYSEIKSALKGRRFQDIEDVTPPPSKYDGTDIPQLEYQKCFQQWEHH